MAHSKCLLTLIGVLAILPTTNRTRADEWDNTRLTPRSSASYWPMLMRLPPVTVPVVHADVLQQGIDSTWREDGRHLIIDLNGQQLRLAKNGPELSPDSTITQAPHSGSQVYGRLSHLGQPLVHCEVALVPLRKIWNGYEASESVKPLNAITNGNGVYHFVNVPPRSYKLKWRPGGQDEWIRRVEFRPDVRVRANETSHIKDIRTSLRTIN